MTTLIIVWIGLVIGTMLHYADLLPNEVKVAIAYILVAIMFIEVNDYRTHKKLDRIEQRLEQMEGK